jgi:hypothetical protein
MNPPVGIPHAFAARMPPWSAPVWNPLMTRASMGWSVLDGAVRGRKNPDTLNP